MKELVTEPTTAVVEWNTCSNSGTVILFPERAQVTLNAETRDVCSAVLSKGKGAEELANNLLRLVHPRVLNTIVIVESAAKRDRVPSLIARFPTAVSVMPAWRAAAEFWARRFKTFVLIDSRGRGKVRLIHRGNRELEEVGPSRDDLVALLGPQGCSMPIPQSDDGLVRFLHQEAAEEPHAFESIVAAVSGVLKGACGLVDVEALVGTGHFFELFGRKFSSAVKAEIGDKYRDLRVLFGENPTTRAIGACDAASRARMQAGVWVQSGDGLTHMELVCQREIRYATVHPRKFVFSRDEPAFAEAIAGRPVLVVVDRQVDAFYGNDILSYLKDHIDCRAYVTVEGTEKSKNWDHLRRLCDEAIQINLPRNGVIVGVGGGVTLDVAGLAASMFRRGVSYVRIPTSLIGLVDTGVGIKQGINAGRRKNIIGSFYPATININDATFLSTLPERHLACGIAEIAKIAMVCDAQLFETLEAQTAELIARRFQDCIAAPEVLQRAEFAMMAELQENLFETRTCRLPDFGHSFSPVIEEASQHSIAHGEAVAMDMLLSTCIAVSRNLCDVETFNRLLALLRAANLPLFADVCNADLLMRGLQSARAHRQGRLNLIVPRAIGRACAIQHIDHEEIEDALANVREISKANVGPARGSWWDTSPVRAVV